MVVVVGMPSAYRGATWGVHIGSGGQAHVDLLGGGGGENRNEMAWFALLERIGDGSLAGVAVVEDGGVIVRCQLCLLRRINCREIHRSWSHGDSQAAEAE